MCYPTPVVPWQHLRGETPEGEVDMEKKEHAVHATNNQRCGQVERCYGLYRCSAQSRCKTVAPMQELRDVKESIQNGMVLARTGKRAMQVQGACGKLLE